MVRGMSARTSPTTEANDPSAQTKEPMRAIRRKPSTPKSQSDTVRPFLVGTGSAGSDSAGDGATGAGGV